MLTKKYSSEWFQKHRREREREREGGRKKEGELMGGMGGGREREGGREGENNSNRCAAK